MTHEIENDTDRQRACADELDYWADQVHQVIDLVDSTEEQYLSDVSAYTETHTPAPIYADLTEIVGQLNALFRQHIMALSTELRSSARDLRAHADSTEGVEHASKKRFEGTTELDWAPDPQQRS